MYPPERISADVRAPKPALQAPPRASRLGKLEALALNGTDMTSKGVTFYDCKIANRIDNDNTLAFAALVRVSHCGYAYTVSSTHGNRQFTRRFKMCAG